MEKPDFNNILGGLKDFQRRSVDYIYDRLYTGPEPTNRFLIADEVGLGKTLVAKGVIAKSLDFLWDKVDRLDVIYICSNGDIARQNINRLNFTSNGTSLASRITLLPSKLKQLSQNKINFVSFTPGTSFNLRSTTGIYQERALIYSILRDAWGFGDVMGPINLMQCSAAKDNWRRYIASYYKNEAPAIDEGLRQGFIDALEEKPELKERFFQQYEVFNRHRKNAHITLKEARERNRLIGDLRYTLAQSCIHSLKPDIIILDEFQRFKSLLDSQDPMSQLAQHLFNYQNPEKEIPTKVLLLSATPYKMYTMQHESTEDDHHTDFLRTLNFLCNSEEQTKEFRLLLREYRRYLYDVGEKGEDSLLQIRDSIQSRLKKVMVRTERLAVSEDRNGMVQDCYQDYCDVQPEDLQGFLKLDSITQVLGAGNHMEYWKSAPFLLNLMDEYSLKKKLKAQLSQPDHYKVLSSLLSGERGLLRWSRIRRFNTVNPENSRMRKLVQNNLDKGWKLLWVPPSLPYYKPEKAYAQEQTKDFTKALVFSSWQVVPKTIASLCSYEAERRMITAFDKDVSYPESRRRYSSLLPFAMSDDRLTGMPVLALLYPCLTLAQKIDPIQIAREGSELPTQEQVISIIKTKVKQLFEGAVDVGSYPDTGQADERWYWVALAALDKHYSHDAISKWLEGDFSGYNENIEYAFDKMIESRDKTDDGKYADHVNQFNAAFKDLNSLELKRIPDDLYDVLAKFALGAPAIAALRGFGRKIDAISIVPALADACWVAIGFRSMFNLPESTTLIRSIYNREPYWERVLDYSIDGNIQAVMDEYVHILYESIGLMGKPDHEVTDSLSDEIYTAVAIRTTRSEFDDLKISGTKRKVVSQRKSIRCRYAMRFQESKTEDGDVTREDQVRKAFNSPFRPFILATTSIGQEGLDFHQYCRAIYHWNLPSNPVDLEQREGRIHRYKCHVIRQNLAKHYDINSTSKKDPWEGLFNKAVQDREPRENDLKPYWIFETNKGCKIERHIPTLPLSREVTRIEDLRRTLVLYRMVFGQPRQQDLVNFLRDNTNWQDNEQLTKYKIDLTP